MNIVGYARVSSREQAENGHALEQQIERLKSAGVGKIYIDIESAYKRSDRPQLKELMASVQSGEVDLVLVTRLDRLSRQGAQSLAIFDEFAKANTILKALDEPFDLSTASGKMTAGLLAIFAQHHSDQKTEAVRHGLKHLRARKIPLKAPFGYVKNQVGNCLVFDDKPFLCRLCDRVELSRFLLARELISSFLDLKSLRQTVSQIHSKYGIQSFGKQHISNHQRFYFSIEGFKGWITNPLIRGHLRYTKSNEIYLNTHDALISEEEFQEVEKILNWNRQHHGYQSHGYQKKAVYPLSGLILCAYCNRTMVHHGNLMNRKQLAKGTQEKERWQHYYKCQYSSVSCIRQRMVRVSKIEEKLIDTLRQKSYDLVKSKIQVTPTVVKSEILLQLEAQLEGLRALGNNPVIKEAIAKIEEQISQEKFVSDSYQYSKEIESRKQLCLQAFSDGQFWLELQNEDKKRIYRELVDKILVRDGEIVDILLKF